DLGERIVLVQQSIGAAAILGERDAARIRGVPRIERAAGVAIRGWRAVRKAGDEGIVRRHVDLGVIFQQALCIDLGDGDIAAVLAEHQVLAVRRIGYAAIAAARILSKRGVVLQDNAGVGVEYLDGLRRAQGEDSGGVTFDTGVQRDGLRADPDAEVDLGAGWGDDLAVTDDPRAVLLRAGDVGRVLLGLSTGEQRKAQPRCQHAGERTHTVDSRFISRLSSRCFSGHIPFSSLDFFHQATGIGHATLVWKDIGLWNTSRDNSRQSLRAYYGPMKI